MAGGTDFGNKQDLIDAVVALIYTNTSNEVSAADVQLAACHMIETLWRDFSADLVQDITYNDLLAKYNAGTLIPGTYYRFDFENVHLVPGKSIANTEIGGYTPRIEKFLVKATAVNKIDGFALSETNKYDIITYDIAQTTVGGNSVPTNGTVKRRKSMEKSLDAPFDFRNYWVARENADWTAYTQAGTITADRSDFVETGFTAPGDVYGCWFDATVAATFPSVLTGKLWTANDFPNQFFSSGSISGPNGSAIAKDGTVVYLEALDPFSNTDVYIGPNTFDIRVSSSSNVRIKALSNYIDIRNSRDITINGSCSRIILDNVQEFTLGSGSADIGMYACYRLSIGPNSSKSWLTRVLDTSYGDYLKDCLLRDMIRCEVRSYVTSLMTDVCHSAKIGEGNSYVTVGLGVGHELKNECANIVCLGGKYNTFEEGCNTINVDQRNGSGQAHNYQTYAPMEYTTFKKGCNNIVFEQSSAYAPMLVTRCTFGENCQNLTFDNPIEDTTFARSTKNKDFRGKALSGVTFLNPSPFAWTYSAGVYGGEFLTSGFSVAGSPDPLNMNTNIMQRESDTNQALQPIVDSTYQRVFVWNHMGRPVEPLVS